MSFYQRLRYSLYLTVVGGALVGLVVIVASADVVGLLPATAFDLLMPPGYLLVVFALAFLAAPMVARSFPITGVVSAPEIKTNAKNNYIIRLIIWAGIGVLLALLVNLLVYLLR